MQKCAHSFPYTTNMGEHFPISALDEVGAYKLLPLKQPFCSALLLPLRVFIVKALWPYSPTRQLWKGTFP